MASMDRDAAIAALQWHIDNGVDEALADEPVDATAMPALPQRTAAAASRQNTRSAAPVMAPSAAPAAQFLGASEARQEAVRLAKEASTPDELREAIAAFDGISLKKTATNLSLIHI